MSPDTKEKILAKIKKLLNLSDGNQNKHERDLAMKRAMDLLSAHNLEMHEAEGFNLDTNKNEELVMEQLGGFTIVEPWTRTTVGAAARLYYTTLLFRTDRHGHYKPLFIGSKENIDVTIEITKWLIKSIRKECIKVGCETPLEKRSFCLGAAVQVLNNVEIILHQEKNKSVSTATGSALMVIRDDLMKINAEYIEKKMGKIPTMHTKGPKNLDPFAFMAGRHYGNKLNLGKQIEQKKPEQQPNIKRVEA